MGTVPDTIITAVCCFFKNLLEKLMVEERNIYLEDNLQTKANGYYERNLNSLYGDVKNLKIPRSRDSFFRSSILPDGKTEGHLENIIAQLFTSGISSRKIEQILEKNFQIELSHTSISRLAQVAYEEVQAWKQRPLRNYAVVFIDAFYFPVKRETVQQEAVYVALGISEEGEREVIGFWIPGGSEGSSNWAEIFVDLQQRGVKNIDFIVADGLSGISEVISMVYPKAKYQYCVVHACRTTLNKVRATDKKFVSQSIKKIYSANSKEEARKALEQMKTDWNKAYPKIVAFWERNFDHLTQFMRLPNRLWRFVYTTNWVERLHKEIRRRINSMEQFQTEASAEKILYSLYLQQNQNYEKTKVNAWQDLYKMYKSTN